MVPPKVFTAMEKTGTSQVYAEAFLRIFSGYPPSIVLAGFIVLMSINTQLLSDNATAVLLIPMAISTALGLGVHPKPMIMADCFGASACFARKSGRFRGLMR
jgi:di/tricarboxylate transporter